jgi:2-phospho-L-lactate guanylyltransferase
MRGIARGKSRLASVLDRAERSRLNRRLLKHTLEVIRLWQGGLGRCMVVSGCAQTLRTTSCAGALGLREPRPSRGLDRAIAHGIDAAIRRGARAVVVLPSDLPLLTAGALDALLDCAASRCAGAIAPDTAGTGTNALLLKTRARFKFSYGPESYVRHLEEARKHGWDLAIVSHPQLALDIDLESDLVAWRNSAGTLRQRMV